MDLFLENLSKPEYEESTRFLYKLQFSGIKLGLKNIEDFLEYLGNPHRSLRTIHLAGTNGKGSTLAFMESILREAGYKVGAYSSPHLVSFQERIRINGELIPLDYIHHFVKKHQTFISSHKLTFFEATTGLAFAWFASRNPDVVLLESGLGGRLDSTNVVHAPVCVITHIDFDHEPYLGNTIEKIAFEKAGIIFPDSRVFSFNHNKKVQTIIATRCSETGAVYHEVSENSGIAIESMSTAGTVFHYSDPEYSLQNLRTRMPGTFQLRNIELAIYALLHQNHFPVTKTHVRKGVTTTLWPGRLQRVNESPDIFVDAGHNADGFQNALSTLDRIRKPGKFLVVCGIVNDKNAGKIAGVVESHADRIYLVSFQSPRFLPSNEFAGYFNKKSDVTISNSHSYSLIKKLKSACHADDTILLIGSHYLLGEFFMEAMKSKKRFDFHHITV